MLALRIVRAGFRALRLIAEQPVFSADHMGFAALFGQVVAETAASVFQVSLKERFPVPDIGHRFIHTGAFHRILLIQPFEEVVY